MHIPGLGLATITCDGPFICSLDSVGESTIKTIFPLKKTLKSNPNSTKKNTNMQLNFWNMTDVDFTLI